MSELVLETRHLHKRFGALRATQDVSVTLRRGEIHAIIGPNGAGKSTLIQQICGGLRPDAGQVLLSGQDITALPTAARARAGLGRTFQISQLCAEDSVLDNVMLAAIGATGQMWRLWGAARANKALVARAEAAIARAGLWGARDTPCAALSHGQRRQLEIALALALRPKAFILDEPMAGMGTEGSQNLVGLLDDLRAEAPILLVEHDMDAVFALADRISVLVYGQVIATGTAAEIRQSAAVQEAYLGEAP